MLIRHLLCILCYIGIIQYYCYILLFYCYIVLCVYITHCTHIFNHCNDLALNGSLIGNKYICIVLYCIVYCQRHLKHIFVFYVSDTANLRVPNQIRMSMVEKLLWNSWCIINHNYSAILATLQITLYVGGG